MSPTNKHMRPGLHGNVGQIDKDSQRFEVVSIIMKIMEIIFCDIFLERRALVRLISETECPV